MARYAKTDGTTILRFRNFDNSDTHLSRADAEAVGKPFWLPYIIAPRPVYDRVTQEAPVQQPAAILTDRVEQVWAAPVDKTQATIDAEKAERDTNAVDQIDGVSSIEKALGMVLFEVVNKVRVLEGDQPITGAQFKTYLKGKL